MPADAATAAVDVWVASSSALDPRDLARMAAVLTAEEAARGARFVRAADRDAFVLTRALVRTRLSLYGPTAPADWRFVTNEHQCPSVARHQAGSPWLSFNVSHTDGLVVLAVTRGHRVGIDVENVTRTVLEAVPERHFAPDEVRDLRSRPAAEQARVFFDYWTLKEAYIKARGMGLALPLDQFAFALHGAAPPSIRFAPGFADDASRWQFRQLWPTATHRLALAVERDGADLPVTVRHVTPAALVP